MALKKRDLLFVLIIAAVLGIFFAISGKETTTRVPRDETHLRFYDLVKTEGKKAAEQFCKDCHNPEKVPLPEGHPPPFRCLFCHKLQEQ